MNFDEPVKVAPYIGLERPVKLFNCAVIVD